MKHILLGIKNLLIFGLRLGNEEEPHISNYVNSYTNHMDIQSRYKDEEIHSSEVYR